MTEEMCSVYPRYPAKDTWMFTNEAAARISAAGLNGCHTDDYSDHTMNVAEFTGSLDLLDLSQTDAGRLFKVSDRTVRRWIAGEQPIPEAVAIALRLMIRFKVSPNDI